MAKEPHYPEDAPVEGGQPQQAAASAKAVDPERKRHLVRAGVAVGIGSAAIVAALLYANRSRKGDKGGK